MNVISVSVRAIDVSFPPFFLCSVSFENGSAVQVECKVQERVIKKAKKRNGREGEELKKI